MLTPPHLSCERETFIVKDILSPRAFVNIYRIVSSVRQLGSSQVWNYRTKRLLVSHPFEQDGAPQHSTTSVGDQLKRGAGGSGANSKITPPESDAAEGGRAGKDAGGPVGISLHPSGDAVAVAFANYISVYYIVGGGGNDPEEGGGLTGKANTVSSSDVWALSSFPECSVRSPDGTAVLTRAACAMDSPLAALRADQREFLTKGMFSVAGEVDPVINHDPVSAVQYSPGGHLLAVITGKVR